MLDFDVPFDDMGLQLANGWTVGSFSGVAHCTATDDDELLVIDISVDLHKYQPMSCEYDRNQRMLDRTKPAERILFHQLKDALYATHEDVMAEAAREEGWEPYTDFLYPDNQAGRTL